MSLNWTIINISSSPISREKKKTTTSCFIYTITCSISEFLCFFFLVIGFYCDSSPQRCFDFSHFVLNLLTFTPFQHTTNKSWGISSCSHEVTPPQNSSPGKHNWWKIPATVVEIHHPYSRLCSTTIETGKDTESALLLCVTGLHWRQYASMKTAGGVWDLHIVSIQHQ